MGGETIIFDLEAQLLWNHDRVSGYNEQLAKGCLFSIGVLLNAVCHTKRFHTTLSCVNVLHFFKKMCNVHKKHGIISTKTVHTLSHIQFTVIMLSWKQNKLLFSRPLLATDLYDRNVYIHNNY